MCEHLEAFDSPPDDEAPDGARPDECDACNECHDCCTCEVCSQCNRRGIEHCEGCSNRRNARCSDCCECTVCPGCDARSVDLNICETCDHCTDNDCCDCCYCDRCECRVRPRDYCSDCERCSECECSCSNCRILVERGLEFFESTRAHRKRNASKRYIGAEIEVATYNTKFDDSISNAARDWECSIVEDGSLPDGGFELVTSPANGDLWCSQIEQISTALKRASARATNACGLHVHVDARDFTHYDMRRLVMVYAAIEPALFATQPISRRENTYCKPCGSLYARGLYAATTPKASKQMLMQNVYEMTPSKANRIPKRTKYASSRYHALNLHSWMYRGTIECRLHTGSIYAEKIVPWGMLWANLLDYAMQATEREALQVMREHTPREYGYPATQAQIWKQQEWIVSTLANKEIRSYLVGRWSRFATVAPSIMQERAA